MMKFPFSLIFGDWLSKFRKQHPYALARANERVHVHTKEISLKKAKQMPPGGGGGGY